MNLSKKHEKSYLIIWWLATIVALTLQFSSLALPFVDAFGPTIMRTSSRPVTSTTCLQREINTRMLARKDNGNEENQIFNFFNERWEKADPLEIRLDATLSSCHVLARFLVYDITLPKKDIPGFEIEDIIMLVNVSSSVVVLAILWTMAGLITRIFEDRGFDPPQLFSTVAISGPLWLATEIIFHWPPAGVVDPTTDLASTVFLGCIGLLTTISLGRFVSANFL